MTPVLRAAELAPWIAVDALSGGGDVLVLAPHPDDETLGCGGAIAALSDLGRRVQVVVLTDGGQSHPKSRSHPPAVLRQLRTDEVLRAVDVLTGGRGPAPVMMGCPDGADTWGDDAQDAAAARSLRLMGHGVSALWTAWAGDPHIDHVRTAQVARRIARQRPDLAVWSYPIWGRFAKDWPAADGPRMVRLDTGPWQDRKAEALAAHASQMSDLITDDPGGFRMDDTMQHHFLTTPELFLREGAP